MTKQANSYFSSSMGCPVPWMMSGGKTEEGESSLGLSFSRLGAYCFIIACSGGLNGSLGKFTGKNTGSPCGLVE